MKRIDFENGSVTQNIFAAALPMLVAQILNLLYNIVDRIYIARIPHIGTAALGAVGLCFPLVVIITAFANLFGSGGAPLFSISRGQKRNKQAVHIMNTSFTMVCFSAVVLMLIGLLFARPLLILFGASKDALVYAFPYMMIYLIGTLPSMIAIGMNPFINAQGYSTIGMFSVAIGAVANLLLDPFFIFALGFGVRGAAIATVISQCLSASFVLFFLTKKAELKVRFLHKNELSESLGYAKNIISLGTAGFIMQLTNGLVSIVCNNVLSVTGGDIYISVMTIVSSVRQLVETPIYAMNEGGSPILSYNYGANKKDRVKKAFFLQFKICVIFTCISWLVMMLFPQIFAGMFTSDASLVSYTPWALRIYMAGIFALGFQVSCQQGFMALGQAKVSLVMACLRKLILLIPLIFTLPLLLSDKVFAVFLAEPVSDIIAAIVTTTVFMAKFNGILEHKM